MARKNGVAVAEAAEVMITIPVGLPLEGDNYESQKASRGRVQFANRGAHVDAQLEPESATVFLRIRNGLREKSAKLSSGRPVWTNADTFRWIMEQVAVEMG